MSRPETVVAGGMDGRYFEAHQAISETRASEKWAGYIPTQTELGQCWMARSSVREEANDRVRQRHPDQTLERRKPESVTVHRNGHERAVDGDVSGRKQSPRGAMRGGDGAAMVADEAVGLGGSGGDVGRAWLFLGNEPLKDGRRCSGGDMLLGEPQERCGGGNLVGDTSEYAFAARLGAEKSVTGDERQRRNGPGMASRRDHAVGPSGSGTARSDAAPNRDVLEGTKPHERWQRGSAWMERGRPFDTRTRRPWRVMR
jgi:hypothetical protein